MRFTPAGLKHQCLRIWQADVIFWKRHKKKILSIGFIVFHLLGALSSINAVMHTRTPQGAIAWVVSLNTFPYAAVPAYWIFGASKFDDYIAERQKVREQGRGVEDQLRAKLVSENLVPELDNDAMRTVQQLAGGLPFTTGNQAEYLIDGGQTYKSILDGIAEAKTYILFQFYIIRDDEVGRQFRDALTRKAKEGVRVYVMYDEVGSLSLPDSFKQPLIDAGGKFIPFNTTQGFGNRFQLNFRNHRKVVVIDGLYAWIGGINIGEEYEGSGSGGTDQYLRDTHLRMSGPVVQMVQASFVEDWYWAARNIPELDWDPEPSSTGTLKMLCLPTGPTDDLGNCALFYLNAINNAKKRVWISSPYFVPDQQIITALALAILRGVEVRVMVPEETDSNLIDFSHRGIVGEVERTGIDIYKYQRGFNHQKVMLVDDRYSYVGTANFDNRSFRLNFEITMVIDDADFAKKTEAMLNKDFAGAELIPEDAFKKLSFWQRFLSRAALLLAPIQ